MCEDRVRKDDSWHWKDKDAKSYLSLKIRLY